tara:strand:- start:187358 stop:190024 length:2667 start_codon:yes stop_codon:yes gene_type:complete
MSDIIGWEWTRPSALWLLVPAIPFLLWLHVRSLSDFPKWQRWASLLLRTCVVTLLILSLSGWILLMATKQRMLIVAIDRSESVDTEAVKASDKIANEILQSAREQDALTIRFLPFDNKPDEIVDTWPPGTNAPANANALAISNSSANSTDLADSDNLANSSDLMEPDSDPNMGTDIASALRTAIASVPPSYVPKIVLISDGNATSGDAIAAATTAGIPIDTVSLPAREEPEVQIASVTAPAQVRQGEPFFVEVVVNSTTDTSGYLDFYRGDIRIGEGEAKKVDLKSGANRFRIRQSVTGQRQVTFAARLRGCGDADTFLDNNESSALVRAVGRPRVLLVDPDVDQTDSLRWALDEQRIDVEVRPPVGVPHDLAELQGFECLVLSNVPATAMSIRQMDVIRTYVEDLGGGLVMLGGDQSFGLGGYYRTQLEEILPVRSNFEKEREKPSLAMVLVIDKSGSMGGEKIELAKDAARAAVELLGPRDSIGVIAFDGSSYWVSELRGASDKGYVIDQISTIDAGGGTSMYPAMNDAYESLGAASAKLKHCILLTDGISSPGDFEGLASEMAASRMTVTTVAMGQGADETLLEEISRLGGGRYYFCNDPQSVPQVFAKETVEASKSAINELPFLPQLVRPTQVLEGIDLDLAPLLLGYVVTRPKPTCEFILASENGDPLLAWWRYGLGMTVAFTSDAKARWASEWLAWPDFGTFWAQVIRHAMRKNDTRGVFVEIKQRDGNAHIVMDSVDQAGQFVNQAATTLTVINPQLKTEKLPMRQTAPGRYEASIETGKRGAYQIDLAQQRGAGEATRQSRGLIVGYHDELRLHPPDTEALKKIAESTGGNFDPSVDEMLRPDARSARLPLPMWPYLLMTALVLFVFDVAVRRVDLGGTR